MLELFRLAFKAIIGHQLRSVLSMIGIAIGIASVILLTSLGEGTRRYMVNQFSQFGTNIIAINPGKADTVGLPGVFGGTTQKLSIDDNEALVDINLGSGQADPRRVVHRFEHIGYQAPDFVAYLLYGCGLGSQPGIGIMQDF